MSQSYFELLTFCFKELPCRMQCFYLKGNCYTALPQQNALHKLLKEGRICHGLKVQGTQSITVEKAQHSEGEAAAPTAFAVRMQGQTNACALLVSLFPEVGFQPVECYYTYLKQIFSPQSNLDNPSQIWPETCLCGNLDSVKFQH